MWFKLDDKRTSKGQRYINRCAPVIGGTELREERPATGKDAARKAAEMLATSLNAPATVYGQDGAGEFVYGVFEIGERAEDAASPLIKRLYAGSVTKSLAVRDELLADISVDAIKGFAEMSAALDYVVKQHKQVKRTAAPQIGYKLLFRIFCGPEEPSVLTLGSDVTTVALLTKRLSAEPGWMWLSDITGIGFAERQVIIPTTAAPKVTLNIDGDMQVLRPRTAFRGTVPGTGAQFMLVAQSADQGYAAKLDGVAVIYREADEAAVIALVRTMLRDANPFKNRIVLINRDLYTVRSRMSERNWASVVPHPRAKEELDFIAAAIRDRDMLRAQGLTMRRGLLLSGPPGDGKSTAIECFVNGIAGEATVIVVEAVSHIRAVYDLAQTLAPAVVILEDLDLMTKARHNPYAAVQKDEVTGELLQVLSGGSAYDEVVTIATTNHPEAIDEALSKRAGRFDAHVRMGYPGEEDKARILDLYLDRFEVVDELTRRRLHRTLTQDLGKLHLVPAHIEEFVKAGIKRARLARRTPEFSDFEPGIDATKSIATVKPAA